MNKFFRWQGLLGFVAVLGVLALAHVLFIDTLIRHVLISSGSAIVGAEVELDEAELKLFDGELRLKHLQVTNVRAPLRNLIEVAQIEAKLDPRQLFWKRVHIGQLAIKGMQFDTARSRSGALPGVQGKGALDLLPQLTQLDWNALDNKEGLEKLFADLKLDSLEAVADLRQDLKTAEDEFKQKIDALPSGEQLRQYDDRLQKLAEKPKGNKLEQALIIVQRGKELEQLRKDIRLELAKLKAVQTQYENSRRQLQAQYERVRHAPENDLQHVLDKTALDLPGTDKLISSVLGPDMNARLNSGLSLYESATPWINKARVLAGKDPEAPPPPARFAGIDLAFPESDPQPELWVKHAALDGRLHWQGWQAEFSGELSDFSDAPALLPEPLRLRIDARAEAGGELALRAEIDRRSAATKEQASVRMQNVAFSDWTLSQSESLSMSASSGQLDLTLDAQHTPILTELQSRAHLHDLQLTLSSRSEQAFVQDLLAELAKTEAFELSLVWRKTPAAQVREIDSSLDELARNALRTALNKRITAKKAELKIRLQARIDAELEQLKQQWSQYAAVEGILRGQGQTLEDLLKRNIKF